jgi:hypothetical protein
MALAINTLPLTSGDRLTRREFERRYEAMPENFKAELIEGVVLRCQQPQLLIAQPRSAATAGIRPLPIECVAIPAPGGIHAQQHTDLLAK